ncbi:Penicillin-binding protein 1F [Roseivivax sp. THAF40]|uniref:penicillin-binding protein 1C n=1 Tax=unclassified Roseivivax TaxID=2639302 RepID=UPI0012680E72|nr:MULTISPECIES: penicillin-binding protein 1C [unclassified Roseivivax]QFS84628.1 Penicillin-binding protein 1F [Roseivivax sp. THAF197b]QFT48455.1 Penicillin-binding protein 1F [Roseivivax sp. THAF40]
MRALLVLALALWSLAFAHDRAEDWIAATTLPPLIPEVGVEIRDRDDRLLRAFTMGDGRWRLATSLDAVDPDFIAMLIAYEDRRFHQHRGVDPLALLRAAGQAMRHGGIVSGGSTLTMQVSRLLEDSGTGAWRGKLRQMRVALALERQLSKDDILSLYLHLAPYGGNIEGLRAASLSWLGKEPRRLTPAEAALLVALPQAPEARRPDRHAETARTARDRVLARMERAGLLSRKAADSARRDAAPTARHAMPSLAPHLTTPLATGPTRQRLSLDAGLQARLERHVARYMAGRDPSLSSALIAADHHTGEILGYVGAPGYAAGPGRHYVDMARAIRSPGSTLKPLIYGLAFDRGLAHPETLLSDRPVRFGTYAPQNFDGLYRGDVTAREALQLSLNIPVLHLTEAMGPAHLMAALRASGLQPALGSEPGLATALGGLGLSLRDLTQLYAMFAAGGTARPLTIAPDDTAPGPRILSPRAAWQVGHILSDIPPPQASGTPGAVAYKTGTSYGHRDAWALGFDGKYVVGVWIGRADGTPVPGAFGGDTAAPLLFEALGHLRGTAVPLPPPPADTLLVSNAELPRPLQRFADRGRPTPKLVIAFPPDGAVLEGADALPVKLTGAVPPYTLLLNGAPVATRLRTPQTILKAAPQGYSVLSVIDAAGQAARASILVQD